MAWDGGDPLALPLAAGASELGGVSAWAKGISNHKQPRNIWRGAAERFVHR